MRRLGVLTLIATASLAAVPTTSTAKDPCLGEPGVQTCSETVARLSPAAGTVLYYATHPDELIVCVRECGPPTN